MRNAVPILTTLMPPAPESWWQPTASRKALTSRRSSPPLSITIYRGAPNRLEQREGRVDRYGQPAKQVKVIRYFGADNPVDGVVLDVLLNKAREIHRTLGTYVPVPEDSKSVMEAVLNALFLRGYSRQDPQQLVFDFMPESVDVLHHRWERDAEQEKVTRTRFAQRALKPAEVRRELDAVDAVLGDPHAVEDFVLNAAQHLQLTIEHDRTPQVYQVFTQSLPPEIPDAIRFALPPKKKTACGASVLFRPPLKALNM